MIEGVPDVALLNGRTSQEPWLLDRGLHFGDGLFETMCCRQGRVRFLSLHLERLALGCERLQIAAVDPDPLREQIMQLAAGAEASIIKLIVTRGEALARGYGFTGKERATSVLLRYPWPTSSVPETVRVATASLRLGENPALAGLKHLNRLEQVLAQNERAHRGLDELLLLSRTGRLISGTMSNLFLVIRGALATPELDLCGVAGIMRRVVIREAQRAGIPSAQRTLGADDLSASTEVFLTSSRFGVVPVTEVDGKSLPVGALTRRVQALIAPMLQNPTDE